MALSSEKLLVPAVNKLSLFSQGEDGSEKQEVAMVSILIPRVLREFMGCEYDFSTSLFN